MKHARIFALSATVTTAVTLTGCTMGLAMKGMNGIQSCPPEAMTAANQNYSVLLDVQPGQGAEVLDGLTADRQMKLTLKGGDVVEAYMYRTGHPSCRNMPTEREFTPVLVSGEGLVLGVGDVAFEHFRSQSLQVKEIGSTEKPRDTSLIGMWKSLPF